jgi:hypothetical protein
MAKQVETATIVVPTTITMAGDATATVISRYMTNSPHVVTVSLTSDSVTNDVALAFRNALALDADVAGTFIVSGTSDEVVLTDEIARANDTTLNIAIAGGTSTGLTAAPTSANTTAGDGLENGYATLAEFKAYRAARGGSTGTDASDDSMIEDLIESTSRYIDGVCGRRFYKNTADETRYYAPVADNILFVDDLAEAPTSVKADTTFDRTYATTIASSDYDLEPSNALLDGSPYTWLEVAPLSSAYFPEHNRGVQIVGKFGFPSVPDDIKGACLGIALNVYQARTGQSSAGNVSVTASGVVIRPQDVPGWAQQAINKYRRLI